MHFYHLEHVFYFVKEEFMIFRYITTNKTWFSLIKAYDLTKIMF